mgnify:CR=1 FL=1
MNANPETIKAAFELFQRRFPAVILIEHLKDHKGTYAYRVRNQRQSTQAIFCFKRSMNGSEVSVHYDLFKLAKAKDWPVILAVGHNFYKYLPADIERESRLNERDGVTMINFSIRAGESLQKKPEQIPTHPVLEKLKSELQAEEVK